MSVDFDVVCHICKVKTHIGQMMAGGLFSSGYGPNDVHGREEVGKFLLAHQHGELVILEDNRSPEEYKDESLP